MIKNTIKHAIVLSIASLLIICTMDIENIANKPTRTISTSTSSGIIDNQVTSKFDSIKSKCYLFLGEGRLLID